MLPVGALRFLALCTIIGLAAAASSSTTKDLAFPDGLQVVPVYANGSFLSTWHDNSQGCLRCNLNDAAQSRNASSASLSAIVQPWGALTFTSIAAYPSDSVLDFWAKGSGLTAISLYFKDSKSNTLSQDVRFTSAEHLNKAVTILGSDDDGFIHIQVAISALRASANGTNAASPNCATGVATRFDRIIIADISGMGFTVVLDDIKLISKDVIGASAFLFPTSSTLAPVFGTDLMSLRSSSNRYLMKFKNSAAFADVSAICKELGGQLSGPRRFAGLCNTPLSTLGTASSLSWKLTTVTVNSATDLTAMRKALSDKVEYFEADLTAFTTIRELKQAAAQGTGFNITASSPITIVAPRPDWAQPPGWVPPSNQRPAWASLPTDASGEADLSGLWNVTQPIAADPVILPDVGGWVVLPGNNATGNSSTNMQNSTNTPSVALIGVASSNSSNHTGNASAPTDGNLIATVQPFNESQTSGDAAAAGAGTTPDVTRLNPTPTTHDDTAYIQPVDASESTATIQGVASWGLDRINQANLPLDGYYTSGDYDGRGVHVYVLDTGLRTSHADFVGRVGDGASAVGSTVADDHGHGTHVAGTAVGSIHGVARSATLHPVKVLGSDGSGSYSNIISGIQWVVDHKKRNNYASAIISMSLAGPRSASLNDAVEAAAAARITVVTAAGNNKGGDSCTMSPCSSPSTITVGASTDSDSMSSFSNIGTCLSVFAPGSSITSASYSSDQGETIMSGTSMAAPHVTGAAALYLQYRPGASPSEVKSAIKGAAVAKFFESSSPQALLNMMSARLRAAGPSVARPPTPSPSPKPATPTTPRPIPSPSPKPAPMPSTPSTSFGSFPSMPSSICQSCSWCMFC